MCLGVGLGQVGTSVSWRLFRTNVRSFNTMVMLRSVFITTRGRVTGKSQEKRSITPLLEHCNLLGRAQTSKQPSNVCLGRSG